MPVITTYVLQGAGVAPTVAITFGLTAIALFMGIAAQRAPKVAVS